MTGTLAFVFIGVALLCVVAGVLAVTRTRRAAREDEEEYGADDEMTYAEEAAAVAAAQAAAAQAAGAAGAAGAADAAETDGPTTAGRDDEADGGPRA
jgi:hypothetical protein